MNNITKYYATIVFICGLSVSISAAFYSVFGLGKLFGGASTQVMVMATTLEISKLVVAATLQRYWSTIGVLMKTYLLIATVALVGITSLGIYGYLSSAYQYTKAIDAASTEIIQIRQSELDIFKTHADDLQQERTKLSNQINSLRTSLTNNTEQRVDKRTGQLVITTSGSNRKTYENQISYAMTTSANIDAELSQIRDSIISKRTAISELTVNSNKSSELGPLKYLSVITGVDIDIIVNYLILILILVFDPLAVILLILSQHIRANGVQTTISNVTEENIKNDSLSVDNIYTEKKDENFQNNFRVQNVIHPVGAIQGERMSIASSSIYDNNISNNVDTTDIITNNLLANSLLVQNTGSLLVQQTDISNSVEAPQDIIVNGGDLPKKLSEKLKSFLSSASNKSSEIPISEPQRRLSTDNQLRELERKTNSNNE